jgi:hypothetical protein
MKKFNPIWIITLLAGVGLHHGGEWMMVHSPLNVWFMFACAIIGILIADISMVMLAYLVIFEFESTKKYFVGLIKRFRLRRLY